MRNIATLGMMLLTLCLVQNVEATGGVTGSGWVPTVGLGFLGPSPEQIATAEQEARDGAQLILDVYIDIAEFQSGSRFVDYFYTHETWTVTSHETGIHYFFEMHNVALVMNDGTIYLVDQEEWLHNIK